jgi:type I restriction enzyme R subunit
MTKEYSEDELVEQSAIKVLKDGLKYDYLYCMDEWKTGKSPLGRETKSDVVLIPKLKEAIDKLNPGLPEEAKQHAINELLNDRSRLSLVKANQEIYKLIKNGIKVNFLNKKGEYEDKTVRVIDFEDPKNNDFFLASQFWITGEIYPRRPDLIGFINGIPMILVELKAPNKPLKAAFDENITDYKDTIPHLFWYNAFIIISNGKQAKIGTLSSGFEHFNDWKRINSENEAGIISLDTVIKGTCAKDKFMDLLENFILFTTKQGNQIKIIAKNHQYLGVNNAIESFKNRKKNKGKLGVFWHTQGAGKSYSMIFFSQKALRKFEGNYIFLIITDRISLDNQIYQNFRNAGAVTEEEVRAKDGDHLKQLLKEDHRHVFTLIQKFKAEKGEKYPQLSDRDDIIIMTDEAHRTQYDVLALNMRNALPNACFLAFTGTPLMAKGEEKTKETFGKYVSVYNFRASIEDNATVPLFYENRVPELHLKNPELNEDIYNVIDEADLDEKQEEKLAREFSKQYHIITRGNRLNSIAKDIVDHYINRGYDGKAMVVSVDKFTTVKMYDKVQHFWKKKIEELTNKLKKAKYEEVSSIKKKIDEMKKTDMAVVLSFTNTQNEIKKFRDEGLNIVPHRKRMKQEDLAELFKEPESNFKIVFVCHMWMTGFDVECLSTIYLDKPMKNHTLMQAIARANRVFKDKQAGFIIDYINVFRNLKKALAIYAQPLPGGKEDIPIQSKDSLVKALKEQIEKINEFLKKQAIDYEEIIKNKGMKKIKLLDDAVSSLVVNEETKKNFLATAGSAIKVYKSILPHKKASEFSHYIALYQELIKEIKSLDPEVDISEVIHDIQNVLDESISSKGYIIREAEKKNTIDLSKINFDALKKQFEKKRTNTEIERLRNILSFKLKELIKLNSLRVDFQEKFQMLIDDYNLGSINQETFFNELIKFSHSLDDEERRKIKERLTEEELALFDKLKKPKLTEKEKGEIKRIAKQLLSKLKSDGINAVDWRKKQQIKARVRIEIEKQLSTLRPKPYSESDLMKKSDIAFQHFYDNYYGDGKSVYTPNYNTSHNLA